MTDLYFRKAWIILVFITTSTWTYSQNNTIAAGNQAVGVGGSSSYSVGQVVYNVQSGSNGNIIQGVQQPFEIMVLSNPEFRDLSLSVYPNPSKGMLHLTADENYDISDIYYSMFDINGKITSQKIKVNSNDEIIQMGNLQSGLYILSITRDNQILKSFKILKN